MITKLFRFAAFLAVVSVIVWLTRERMLPTPHVSHEPPPHYRSTPPPPEVVADDLTEIKGIGQVYAARLNHMGITSFRALSEAEPQTVADSLETSPSRVTL
ncbi:MAG: DUF4332 domain-containing protein, partial [Actinomycetota bacterium]|nr:DUF4332 domain-containing protein [Actinomycetota bacterium]